jgi:ribosomal protein S12 methylthiotransferase
MLVEEAERLVAEGVKEIALIAQDSTAYGTDIYGKRTLSVLLEKLSQVKGLAWLRLHYAYPNDFPMDVLDVMREHENICRYLDIPLQHVSENVLKAMSRPSNPQRIRSLIETIRRKVPDIAIRTTLLSGFPTETAADHKELLAFLKNMQFDRVGIFSYSQEEGTPAFLLGDPASAKMKEQRKAELYALQEQISLRKNQAKIGKVLKTIIDGFDEEWKTYIGRTEFDSPDVDGVVFIKSEYPLAIAEFYDVEITQGNVHDLDGKIVTK